MATDDDINASIFQHMRSGFNAAIGEKAAVQIRAAIESLATDDSSMAVRGRDMTSALPKNYTVTVGQIREAVRRGG